ncbi:pentapeptide repeat-containing protein [Streptomyces sp. NPDC048278]|uniref:pentapeptide repeat-containing protein n=1 Tax=Streptomyces sp. NPDC048278 TaxID=3155809 RepID=UPI00343DE96E
MIGTRLTGTRLIGTRLTGTRLTGTRLIGTRPTGTPSQGTLPHGTPHPVPEPSCPTRRPGSSPIWNCCAPGWSTPAGCIRWSPWRSSPGTSRPPGARTPTRPGSRASWSAGAPRTASAWSTGCCPRSTTPRTNCGARNSWWRSAVRRCPACGPSTTRTAAPTASPASVNASTTGTPPARWPSSKDCSGPKPCCATDR